MKLCAALLLCVIVVAGHGQEFSRIPLKDPFNSLNASQVEEIKISGEQLAMFKNGDYVHPTFSPDGKSLAYSKVLVERDFENTEIFLYNVSTRRTSVLLNSRSAKKYGTYKAFVLEMDWTSPRRLGVVIHDGDVDSTRLTFDPLTKRLLRKTHQSGDDLETRPLSPAYKRARQQAVTLFPEFPREVLDSAFLNSALVLPEQGIILQKNYAGHDDDVWFLDFKGKSVRRLVNLPQDALYAFRGGLTFESSIIIALAYGSKTYLFLYRDGQIKPLTELKSHGQSWIEIKHRSSEGVVFLVRTHESYEKGDNPLFIFNGDRLLQVKEYSNLHDAAVDPAGQRIAYCYWEGNQRHIAIKELN
ncbi:MAG TPA: hypothetical protein VFR78_13005 [Pyrinomonadaceae bacterium]|nr:hypothetical protein [Pyrinomonadaceae bacterium]